jgi:hypothetical protein
MSSPRAGVKLLMLEAGRNYDPITETPMFETANDAPLRGMATPEKPFGHFDATVLRQDACAHAAQGQAIHVILPTRKRGRRKCQTVIDVPGVQLHPAVCCAI